MNYRFVLNQLGMLLIVLAVILLAVAGWELVEYALLGAKGEGNALSALLASAGVGLVAGGALWFVGRAERRAVIGRREAILLVGGSWFGAALLSALPYYLWAQFPGSAGPDDPFKSFVDCYFEAMSGLSTAGSSVLSDIESLPRGLLLWRSLTHWLGGLGIVVLFVIVLPIVGVGSKRLVSVESPVHARGGMRPRILQTARVVLVIYVGLTTAEVVALCLCGMPLFDAINHAFATIATGGFSTRNASIGAYDSASIDTVVTVFMLLGATNFGLYYLLVHRRFASVWRNTELRCFIVLVLVGVTIVTVSIHGTTIVTTANKHVEAGLFDSIRYAAFNVVSMQTDTGFATADFDTWPDAARATIFVLTIIGGCVGSTSGGIKVVRVWVLIRVLFNEVHRTFRPGVIRSIRAGEGVIDDRAQRDALCYFVAFVVTLFAGAGLVHLFEQDQQITITTSITAAIATICDAGPGLGAVGPTQNFGWMSAPSKIVLATLMLLGRLEIFTLLVLLTPRFWRTT